jgi:hypothetical protein
MSTIALLIGGALIVGGAGYGVGVWKQDRVWQSLLNTLDLFEWTEDGRETVIYLGSVSKLQRIKDCQVEDGYTITVYLMGGANSCYKDLDYDEFRNAWFDFLKCHRRCN